MAIAEGSLTDLCTPDPGIRPMAMMMDKSGRQYSPLAPHRPIAGSKLPKGEIQACLERHAPWPFRKAL